MIERSILILSLFFVMATVVLQAEDTLSKAKEKCFTVNGRYSIYAEGDGIWIIGTKRLLNAVSDDLDAMINGTGDWQEYSVFGDFTVCSTERYRPGHVMGVRIQSYKNTKVAKRY